MISAFDYVYDPDGRRISIKRSGTAFGDMADAVDAYVYNKRSEVVQARRMKNCTQLHMFNNDYRYDDIGNRISSTDYDVQGRPAVFFYISNELNQYELKSVAEQDDFSQTFFYDDDGSMTSDGRFTYFWNGENRMICASNAEMIVTYNYDRLGRMSEKCTTSQDGNSLVVVYGWDNWNIIRETSFSGNITTKVLNIWGLDLDGTIQGDGGVGGLLAVVRNEQDFRPSYDGNGNISEYLTSNFEDIASHYDYSLFGEPIFSSSSLSVDFDFTFSTKSRTGITSLVQYQLRMLDSDLGRWINNDPIGDANGNNVLFVNNDPIDRVDYLGLKSCYAYGRAEVVESFSIPIPGTTFQSTVSLRSFQLIPAPGSVSLPVILPPVGGVVVEKVTCKCTCSQKVIAHSYAIECKHIKQPTHCEFSGYCGTVSIDYMEDQGWWGGVTKTSTKSVRSNLVELSVRPPALSESDDSSCLLPCFVACNSLSIQDADPSTLQSCYDIVSSGKR